MLDTLQRMEELSSHSMPLRLTAEEPAEMGYAPGDSMRSELRDSLDAERRELRLLFLAGSVLVIGINLGFVALLLGMAPIVPPHLMAAGFSLICILLGFALAVSSQFRE